MVVVTVVAAEVVVEMAEGGKLVVVFDGWLISWLVGLLDGWLVGALVAYHSFCPHSLYTLDKMSSKQIISLCNYTTQVVLIN